jgi:transcriptional regulator with XRE-family HTH domain
MSLSKYREQAGLSQRQLGEALAKKIPSVPPARSFQARISAYETGRNKLSLDVAMALVAILNKELKKRPGKSGKITEITVSDLS